MVQYSTKMIFAVLDVSLIMGLNIGETDKFFFTLIYLMSKLDILTWVLAAIMCTVDSATHSSTMWSRGTS